MTTLDETPKRPLRSSARTAGRRLAEPMPHQFRAGDVTRLEDGAFVAEALPYITRVQVQERLDAVLGPHRWQCSFAVIDSRRHLVHATLIVQMDGTWLSKSDVGGPPSDGSGDPGFLSKSAHSDALKRAATHYGVGRFLRTLQIRQVPCLADEGRGNCWVFRQWLVDPAEWDGATAPPASLSSAMLAPDIPPTLDGLAAAAAAKGLSVGALARHCQTRFGDADYRHFSAEQLALFIAEIRLGQVEVAP